MFEESRSYVAGDLNYSNEEEGYAINADDYALIDSAGTYGTSMPKAPAAANTLIAYASLGRGRIDLNWTAPTDMSNVDGFRIFRSTDGGANYVAYATVAANQRNWFETGLADGTKYNYRVRPYSNTTGNALTTNAAWAVTNLPGPGELSATAATTTGVNLNFTDNTDDESGFEVWQSTSGGAFVLVATLPANAEQGPMSYRVDLLAPGTDYAFRVRAKSAAQSSIFTLRETVTTQGAVLSIANPSFETPVTNAATDPVPGWTVLDDAYNDQLEARSPATAEFPDGAAQGSKALRITRDWANDGAVGIEQTIASAAMPDTRYTVKLKVGAGLTDAGSLLGNPVNPPPPEVALTIGDQVDFASVSNPLNSASLSADGEFQEYTLEFVTGESVATGALKLLIQAFNTGDYNYTPVTAWVDDVSVVAAPTMIAQTPRGGTPWSVPGVIEFEDFDDGGQNVSWLDTTEGNTGGEYRRDTDADVDVARDDTGSFIVGWAKPTEWLEYTIDVINAGSYNLTSYVSAPGAGGAFHWELDGNAIGGTLSVPDTDGYFSYEAVTLSNVTLSQGQHILRLKLDTAGSNVAGWASVANFNYFTLNQTNGNLSQPMGLIATAPYSNRVDLSWTNDDTNAVSFNIQRSSDEDNPTWTTIKTGLRAGTNFYADTAAVGGLYRVIAVGAGGDTLASASVSVTMPEATDRPTVEQPWMINFQVERTIPVPGYLIDSGDLFGYRSNGLAYGWNIDHTIQDRERGINADRRLDTLVHFRQGGEWSIAIPDGPYDVKVSIGDPGWASTYTLNVNGLSYWSNLALAKNTFQQKTMTVNVTDGKIVLDAGTSPDRSTKINYIEITPSGDPPPPEGTPVVKIEAKTALGVLDNTATEGQDGATFTVSRTGDTTGDLLVNYVIDPASTAGSSEYTPLLSGALTILDGEASASFSVTPVEDLDPEDAQRLTLRLSPDASYALDSSATAATVTIYDNDAGSPGIDIGGGITVFPSFGDFDSRLMSVSYAQSLAIPVSEGIQELKTLDIFPMVDNDQPYQYGRDYSATLDGSDVFVDVDRWGLYIIRATYTGGSQPNVTEYWGIEFEIREMEADGDPALPDNEVGPQDVIAGDVAQYMQGAELILINKDTSDKISNWWSEALQPLGNKVQRVGNIEEAINAISTAFFANNLQPIDIVIADHGQGGLQTIGSEIKTVDNKIKHVFNPDSFIGNLDFADEPQPKRQQLLDAQAENNRRFFRRLSRQGLFHRLLWM